MYVDDDILFLNFSCHFGSPVFKIQNQGSTELQYMCTYLQVCTYVGGPSNKFCLLKNSKSTE